MINVNGQSHSQALLSFCHTLKTIPTMVHTKWLPGVWLRHFSPACAVHIEDCEGWWLSGVLVQVVTPSKCPPGHSAQVQDVPQTVCPRVECSQETLGRLSPFSTDSSRRQVNMEYLILAPTTHLPTKYRQYQERLLQQLNKPLAKPIYPSLLEPTEGHRTMLQYLIQCCISVLVLHYRLCFLQCDWSENSPQKVINV